MSATDAKNEFGRVLDRVTQGEVVVITRHDTPKAVMLSIVEYEALTGRTSRTIETLSREFDTWLARMQTPRTRAALKAAFDASPTELGKAAGVAVRQARGRAARKRG